MDPLVLYHNTPSFIDLNEDQPQDDDDDHLFQNLISPHISPSLTLSYPQQDQAQFFFREEQSFQLQASQEVDHKIVSSGGSCDHHHHPKADQESESDYNDLKLRIWKSTSENNTLDDSVKWTSSKMRMMRKMIITNTDHNHHQDHDHGHQQSNISDHRHHGPTMNNFTSSTSSSSNINNNNGMVIVRVCSDCNTTKTPLWRSGPRGPKSLCNACGIRQRKARRAMAAAAADGTGVTGMDDKKSATVSKIQPKVKKSKISIAGEGSFGNNKPQFKKRSTPEGPSSRGRKKLVCFEDILRISMKKSSAFHHVFPQDEKDAAILLMALSYGLVHG